MPQSGLFLRQFSQYALVGGIAFTVDFSTLFVLTSYFSLHYLLSATAGFTLGLAVNYLMCIGWIFKYRAFDSAAQEFAIFAGVGVVGLLLNNALIYIITDWAGQHYLISKITTAAFILMFNFSLRRNLLFTEHRSKIGKPRRDKVERSGARAMSMR